MSNSKGVDVRASAAQVLRSAQKDEQHVVVITTYVNTLFQKWFGVRNWIRLRDELQALSQMSFYWMTSLCGLQTLGEEYVRIVQIDGRNGSTIPSLNKRIVEVLMHSFGALLLSKAFLKANTILNVSEAEATEIACSNQRQRLISLLKLLQKSLPIIHSIHLVLFYLTGDYYHLSKRLANIGYKRLSVWSTESRSQLIYKLIGCLTLTQLCVSLIIQYWSSASHSSAIRLSETKDVVISEQPFSDHQRCALCLQKRCHSTLTSCGHLYCWKCITEWLRIQNECPLCRQKVEISRLVFLNNYF